jgi:DNA-directed RNA polymerase subunit RPC12/RpoP
MSEYICERCGANLTKAIQWFGMDEVKFIHEKVHLKQDLEKREQQLHELQVAGKRIIDGWEKNLTEPVQELAGLVPEVTECPWCDTPILDPTATKDSECPECDHNLRVFRNEYRCDDCNEEWEDTWSSACDDECPKCGTATSPHESNEVEPHDVDD